MACCISWLPPIHHTLFTLRRSTLLLCAFSLLPPQTNVSRPVDELERDPLLSRKCFGEGKCSPKPAVARRLRLRASASAKLRCAGGLRPSLGDLFADNHHHRQSQKPGEELYESFRQSFPELHGTTAGSSSATHSLADALDLNVGGPARCVDPKLSLANVSHSCRSFPLWTSRAMPCVNGPSLRGANNVRATNR